jgi:hypothetical protein
MGATNLENGAIEKGMSWGIPGVNSPKASNKGSWLEPEVERGVGM